MGEDRVGAVEVHLHLVLVQNLDTLHRAPDSRATDTDRRLRTLPGLEAELDILCRHFISVVELDPRPDGQRHGVPGRIRLPGSDDAVLAQLTVLISGNE